MVRPLEKIISPPFHMSQNGDNLLISRCAQAFLKMEGNRQSLGTRVDTGRM